MHSVGSILHKARQKQKISLGTVFEKTRIHPDFIKALEKDNFDAFASNVQIKGFLKNYALFLGLNPQKIIAFWRRDYDEESEREKEKTKIQGFSKPRIILNPFIFIFSISAFLALIFIGYLLFAYYSFNRPPFLVIYEPQQNITTSKKSIYFAGKVDKYSQLLLNSKKINAGKEGNFNLEIDLAPGENKFSFVAVSKAGKQSKIERTIIRRSGN